MNTIKNFQQVENQNSNYQSQSSYYNNRENNYQREKRGNNYYGNSKNSEGYVKRKRNYNKEYKDFDDIEANQNETNPSNRALISYDDL